MFICLLLDILWHAMIPNMSDKRASSENYFVSAWHGMTNSMIIFMSDKK